jgi:phenylacetate-CoA ligase
VVDKNGEPCEPGERGELVITSLTNYSMPLIRYKIGDMGILSDSNCSCGRGLPMLEKIEGRVTDTFMTKRNELIPAEYFIHLIGVVCNRGGIAKFQVIQEDFDEVHVKIVNSGETDEANLREIKEKIKFVMGEDTDVEFEFVSQIKRLPSGKYRYTISKVYKN